MTTDLLLFEAFGVAKPKGSPNAFPFRGKDGRLHATVTQPQSAKHWESIVRASALAAQTRSNVRPQLYSGPVSMTVEFYLPAPKKYHARLRQQRGSGISIHHTTRPDLDKLVRAVKDALTGLVWADDSQVCVLHASKRYADPDEQPMAVISVYSIP